MLALALVERMTSALRTIDLMRGLLNVDIPSRCFKAIGEDICGALWDQKGQDLVHISSGLARRLPGSIRCGAIKILSNLLDVL